MERGSIRSHSLENSLSKMLGHVVRQSIAWMSTFNFDSDGPNTTFALHETRIEFHSFSESLYHSVTPSIELEIRL
jgi:uncharacterized damage-inducible protein DinB